LRERLNVLKCLYGGTLTLPADTRANLASQGIELTENPYHRPLTEDDLVSLIPGYDAVLAGPEPYTAKVIGASDKLKVIARTGVGFDKVDLQAATKRGIYVTWTPIEELSTSVAEHTMALILAQVKRLPQMNFAIRHGTWERQKWSSEIRDLYSLKLGLLGVGRIGSEVAKRAKSFGMTVIYNDQIRAESLEKAGVVEYVPFDTLLAESDVLSIHVPLTPETKGIVGDKAIHLMKKGSIIVNTSRGGIVDEKALMDALVENRLGGASLDVLTEEPPSEHHIFYKLGDRIPSLMLTGHIGFGTATSGAMVRAATDDIGRVLNGQVPKYLLNKDVLNARVG
jgi:phosphoglycerate dehydrogenase-like enzyme